MSEPGAKSVPEMTPIPELPPVEPPTAGFILQLFVVPAVIVAVLVIVVALFGKLAEGQRDASKYVASIRSGNFNVRWRAAHELASLIQNEPALAQDPRLLGALAGLLTEELNRPEVDTEAAQYLTAALGLFEITQGQNTDGAPIDAAAVLIAALDARRPMVVRVRAAESLARVLARNPSSSAPAAVAALVRAAGDPEPELRQRAVFALGFCGGQEAKEAIEKALNDSDRFVRYNAANALARRGDPAAVPVLREMLSTADLKELVRAESPGETDRRVEALQLEALAALEAARKAGHADLLAALRSDLAALERSPWPTSGSRPPPCSRRVAEPQPLVSLWHATRPEGVVERVIPTHPTTLVGTETAFPARFTGLVSFLGPALTPGHVLRHPASTPGLKPLRGPGEPGWSSQPGLPGLSF